MIFCFRVDTNQAALAQKMSIGLSCVYHTERGYNIKEGKEGAE